MLYTARLGIWDTFFFIRHTSKQISYYCENHLFHEVKCHMGGQKIGKKLIRMYYLNGPKTNSSSLIKMQCFSTSRIWWHAYFSSKGPLNTLR